MENRALSGRTVHGNPAAVGFNDPQHHGKTEAGPLGFGREKRVITSYSIHYTKLYDGLAETEIDSLRIVRCGVDARKKPRVLRTYTVEFNVADEVLLLKRHAGLKRLESVIDLVLPEIRRIGRRLRVLVVGMGPAGLFAALRLAQQGVSYNFV